MKPEEYEGRKMKKEWIFSKGTKRRERSIIGKEKKIRKKENEEEEEKEEEKEIVGKSQDKT